jgi:transcription antitermination protein NusB
MAARSKARKRAVDVLYESDVRGTDPITTLAERLSQADPPVPDYSVELVEGVTGNLALLDETLGEHSEGWTVERMPPVDRAVLRLALYELLVRDDVPDAVVIDEAVELAKSLSTDESPRFVNGVLGRVLRERPAAVPPPAPLPSAPAAPAPE